MCGDERLHTGGGRQYNSELAAAFLMPKNISSLQRAISVSLPLLTLLRQQQHDARDERLSAGRAVRQQREQLGRLLAHRAY